MRKHFTDASALRTQMLEDIEFNQRDHAFESEQLAHWAEIRELFGFGDSEQVMTKGFVERIRVALEARALA